MSAGPCFFLTVQTASARMARASSRRTWACGSTALLLSKHSAVTRELPAWGKQGPGPGACDQMGAGAGSWGWSGALECPVSIRWAVGERSWPAMLCRLHGDRTCGTCTVRGWWSQAT